MSCQFNTSTPTGNNLNFSGKPEKWNTWKMMFRARANLMQYADLLSDSCQEKGESYPGYESYKKMNDLGHYELVTSMKLDEDNLEIVGGSYKEGYPFGSFKVAWDRLKAKY